MSIIHENTSVYDPYWSVYPAFILLYWFSEYYKANPAIAIRQIIVSILVMWWALRLTVNWAKYWNGMEHEDWRYSQYRGKGVFKFQIINLFGLQLMPTIWVFLGCMSLYPALKPGIPMNLLDLVAIAVTINAVLFETIADKQVHEFLKQKEPGQNIETGLWKYSRHPNYFGEVTFWWGLWLFGIAADFSYWWTIVGPIAITLLFVFISIPMMERRNLQRRPGYEDYRNSVSMLVPWKQK